LAGCNIFRILSSDDDEDDDEDDDDDDDDEVLVDPRDEVLVPLNSNLNSNSRV